MSLFKGIPRLTLKPDVAHALSPTAWQAYFVLLWWIFFFPQALRDQVAANYDAPSQRRRLLQMAATLFLLLLAGVETLILVAQIGIAKLALSVAWQGLLGGLILGGLMATVGFIYARSSEISAALRQLRQAWGQASWRLLKPLLQQIARRLLPLALRTILRPLVLQIFESITDQEQAPAQQPADWAVRSLAGKFARGVVLGVAGGLTGALAGTLFLIPMFDGAFVDFTSSPLYSMLVGGGLGVTLNLLLALSDQPHRRLHLLNRFQLLGAVLTLPVIDAIQSLANPEALIDLSLDALSVAATGAGAFYVSAWLSAKRPLDWLVHSPLVNLQLKHDPSQLRPPHVTLFPLRNLQSHLEGWLATDWDNGLKNAEQLWSYTCQFAPITTALHNVLATLPPEQQVASVVRFVDAKDEQGRGYPWLMILYGKRRKSKTIATLPKQSADAQNSAASKYIEARRDEIRARLVGEAAPLLPLDSAAQATVAGFWYLTNHYILESATVFALLPDSELSKEIQALANAFCVLLYKENLLNQPRVEILGRPKEPKRKPTWDAIDDFKSVIRYGWLYKQCIEPEKRKTVLDLASQKLGEIAKQEKIARPDRLAIVAIVKIWLEDLEKWQNTQHKAQPMKPCNPFICFEPVRTQTPFVGRDGLLKQLKQAWTQGTRQPVLLYGPAQTGKSSLVQRASDAHKEYAVVVPIHLAVVRKSNNLTNRILWTLYQALVERAGYGPIRESEFLVDPYAVTERAVRTICGELKKTLVLVVDEFDLAYRNRPAGAVTEIGDLIPSLPATEKLLEFWWHLYRSIHNLSFVFIIQSPREDFPYSPFDEYLWPVPVGNLDKDAVGKVLSKPNPDFSPLFTPDAVASIMRLTAGQPFLVQLLGHLTMQRFNAGLSKEPQPSPVFEAKDVDQALTDPQYQQSIEHHVARILQQLNTAQPGSERVLQTIAADPDGITTAELEQTLAPQLPWSKLEIILGFLQTQGVVKVETDRWQVVGELLRREVA